MKKKEKTNLKLKTNTTRSTRSLRSNTETSTRSKLIWKKAFPKKSVWVQVNLSMSKLPIRRLKSPRTTTKSLKRSPAKSIPIFMNRSPLQNKAKKYPTRRAKLYLQNRVKTSKNFNTINPLLRLNRWKSKHHTRHINRLGSGGSGCRASRCL